MMHLGCFFSDGNEPPTTKWMPSAVVHTFPQL